MGLKLAVVGECGEGGLHLGDEFLDADVYFGGGGFGCLL